MRITVEDMDRFGGVIVRLFLSMYGRETTVEQMRADAPEHLWIRTVLKEIDT